MLDTLTISNYALIDNVCLHFHEGLGIITGETGAGKSIMLGALGLLLGERAEVRAISDKSRKTIVEAVFTNPDSSLFYKFDEYGLDWNPEEILVRREISPNGRSRAFINDSPVTLPVLSSITGGLVDIHSQNSNSKLSNAEGQLDVVDAYGKTKELLGAYRDDFNRYITLRAKIRKIQEGIERNRQNRDFIAFQLEQLDKVNLKTGELKSIEQEFDILSDADQIKDDLSTAYGFLDDTERGAVSLLGNARSSLEKVNLSLFSDGGGSDLLTRLQNAIVEIKDISETVGDWLDKVEVDPFRLTKVTERMNEIYDAIRHFKVKDDAELIELHNDLREKLKAIDFGDEDISALKNEAKSIGMTLKNKAEALTQARKEAASFFSKELEETASELGLPNLKFTVTIQQGKLTSSGQDYVEFMTSFNKNHPVQPMSKVASGGETARLMLSIKSIMAKCMKMPTVIFDEVDTGVSGDIADRMGNMMKKMGEGMQVLAITHLPQVASKGSAHFKVYKTDETDRTISHVRELTNEERVEELAGMLSGTKINEAAKLNARALLDL